MYRLLRVHFSNIARIHSALATFMNLQFITIKTDWGAPLTSWVTKTRGEFWYKRKNTTFWEVQRVLFVFHNSIRVWPLSVTANMIHRHRYIPTKQYWFTVTQSCIMPHQTWQWKMFLCTTKQFRVHKNKTFLTSVLVWWKDTVSDCLRDVERSYWVNKRPESCRFINVANAEKSLAILAMLLKCTLKGPFF